MRLSLHAANVFLDNPEIKKQIFAREITNNGKPKKRTAKVSAVAAPTVKTVQPFDILSSDALRLSLKNYRDNGLARFLFSIIEEKEIDAALKRYFVGTWTGKEAVFWQVDTQNRIRTGKLVDYCPYTGKRRKSEYSANWVHAELKKTGEVQDNFALNQCYFGEHLLRREIGKPVAIVESEKSAVIASIFQPAFVWLAIGGKSYLKAERLRKLIHRKVILFPDADGFAEWNETATEAQRYGFDVVCSDVIERFATTEEKHKGFDIADYLLSAGQSNHRNLIDTILNDAELREEFDFIGEERAAIMQIDGNLSALEVNAIINSTEFLHSLALEIYLNNNLRKAAIKR